MPNIILCTNFSETSRNAFDYACPLLMSKPTPADYSLLLLNVYTIPASYSGDGLAIATINNALNYAEEDLHEELEWAHENYPQLNIIGKVTTGRLLDAIKEEITNIEASLVILGTGGKYGELWSWDSDILNALRTLPVPVLTIPPGVQYAPLHNIAFACNYKHVNTDTPFQTLKNLITFTNAHLHIVYVTSQPILPGTVEEANEKILQNKLSDLSPTYHTILENEIVGAIGRFVEQNNIQLLLVMPRKHGIWESVFHKNYTREFAKLNRLPIMAVHDSQYLLAEA